MLTIESRYGYMSECSQQNSFNFLFEIFHNKMLVEEKYKEQNKKYLLVVLNSYQRTGKKIISIPTLR